MSLAEQMAATCDPAGLAVYCSKGHWKCALHLDFLNQKLLGVAAGRIKRLIVTLPPRHGKSELCSVHLPAWWLGRRPDDRIILASYESDFAASWGRRVRDLLDEHGPALFGVRLRADSAAAARWDIEGRRGGMVCAGVGGAITGRGANLFVIDDPVKSPAEAQSEVYSARVWDWWQGAARTRLEPDAAVVLMMTRWHMKDLAGRLLAEPDGEHWEIVNLPALAEEHDPLGRQLGEPLWPERFDLPALEQTRIALGSYLWGALYQGRPYALEGNRYNAKWFRYWDRIVDREGRVWLQPLDGQGEPEGGPTDYRECARFCTADLAASLRTSADWTVICSVAAKGANLFVLDIVRRRMEGPDIVPAIRAQMERHDLRVAHIESSGFQLALVQEARRDGLAVKELRADRDKVARSLPLEARMEHGTVWFPRDAAWLPDLQRELLSFPVGEHDDQVDALAYAAAVMSQSKVTHDWSAAKEDMLGQPSPFAEV